MKTLLTFILCFISLTLWAQPTSKNQFTTNVVGNTLIGDVGFKGNVSLNPGVGGTRTKLKFYDSIAGTLRESISWDNFTSDPQYRGKLLFYSEDKLTPELTLSWTNNQSYVDMIFGDQTGTRKASVNADGSAIFATGLQGLNADGSGWLGGALATNSGIWWDADGGINTGYASAGDPGDAAHGYKVVDITDRLNYARLKPYGLNWQVHNGGGTATEQAIIGELDNLPTDDRIYPVFHNSLIVGSSTHSLMSAGKVLVGGWHLGRTVTSSSVTTNQLNTLLGINTGTTIQAQIDSLSTNGASATNVLVGNTVFVDAVNGSDSTAIRGNMLRPALTWTGALAKANSGDLIQFGPGTFRTLDDNVLISQTNLAVKGAGKYKTFLTSIGSASTDSAFIFTNGVFQVSDLTISNEVHSIDTYRLPVRMSQGDITALFKNVAVRGESDGFFVTGSNVNLTLEDCDLETSYDDIVFSVLGPSALNINGGSIVATNRGLFVSSGSSQLRNVQYLATNVCNIVGARLAIQNGGGGTNSHNLLVNRAASVVNIAGSSFQYGTNASIYNVAGTVNLQGLAVGPTSIIGSVSVVGASDNMASYFLVANAATGALSVTLERALVPPPTSAGKIAIGFGTTNCEIRSASSVAGAVVTWSGARKLTFAHAVGERVLWFSGAEADAAFWNMKADYAGNYTGTDNGWPMLNALWECGKEGLTLVGSGGYGNNGTDMYGISMPMVLTASQGMRHLAVGAIAGGYTAGVNTNAWFMINQQGERYHFTVYGTNTITIDSGNWNPPSPATNLMVVAYGIGGTALPSGLTNGIPFFVKDYAAGWLRVGQHPTGTDENTIATGSGWIYTEVGSQNKIYIEDMLLEGGSTANLNGLYADVQQPAFINNLRLNHFKGTALKFPPGVQQVDVNNLEIDACGVGLDTRGATFVYIKGLNIEQYTNALVGGGTHIWGMHLEGCLKTNGVDVDVTAGGNIMIDGYSSSTAISGPEGAVTHTNFLLSPDQTVCAVDLRRLSFPGAIAGDGMVAIADPQFGPPVYCWSDTSGRSANTYIDRYEHGQIPTAATYSNEFGGLSFPTVGNGIVQFGRSHWGKAPSFLARASTNQVGNIIEAELSDNTTSAGVNSSGSLFGLLSSGAVSNAAGSRVAYLSDVGSGTAGTVHTNGMSVPATFSNSVAIDAAHALSLSNLTASRVVLSAADKTLVSAAASGAVSINADGTATTFAQINALASGNILTNGANLLAADGSVTVPSLGFLSANDGTGTGFYLVTPTVMSVAVNGGQTTQFWPTETRFKVDTIYLGTSDDVQLLREAGNVMQMGVEGGGAQTIHASDGSGSDNAGGQLTIGPGRPTGSGTIPALKFAWPTNGLTGSTARNYGTAVSAGGTLKVTTTDTGNVGAGTDTLISYTLPGGQLGLNGDILEFDVWGYCTNNANPKQITVAFGATTIIDTTSLVLNAVDWKAHGKIVRTGATTQKATVEFTVGGTLLSAVNGTICKTTAPGETLSSDIVFQCTGTSTVSPNDNDIVQSGMTLKLYRGQ